MKVKLREVFRKIFEADIDIDRFTRSASSGRAPVKPPPGDPGMTWSDVQAQHGEKKPETSGKKVGFTDLVPQPRTGPDAMSLAQAKSNGFSKITNWYVNPAHWGRGKGGDEDLAWEGPDILEPKSPEAKKLTQIIHLKKIKPTQVFQPETWKREFEKEFGPYGK